MRFCQLGIMEKKIFRICPYAIIVIVIDFTKLNKGYGMLGNVLFYLWKVIYVLVGFVFVFGSLIAIGKYVNSLVDLTILRILIAGPLWFGACWLFSKFLIMADVYIIRMLDRGPEDEMI